jgi:DNA-binding GntR family transcriptional regulator
MKAIQRVPIRDQIYHQVIDLIIKGRFAAGARIKDTDLASQLGISRTPVRETLLRLEREGFLRNAPGRGFTVSPLDLQEIQEAYPILSILEATGIETYGAPSPAELDELVRLNRRMASPGTDPARLIELDNEFHSRMLAGCANRRLVSMVADLKKVVRRYEYAYMSDRSSIGESVDDHTRLIDLLRAGDLPAVRGALEEHWNRSLRAVVTNWRGHERLQ